jgi:hypothetical protein
VRACRSCAAGLKTIYSARSVSIIQSPAPHCLPKGGDENSPGWSTAQPWDCIRPHLARPVGTDRNLSPHITRVVFDAMLLQKCDKFCLEIPLSMMFFLAGDISQRRVRLCPSDRKSSVTFLPLKLRDCSGFVYPTRRSTLDFAHRGGNRYGGRQREQNVDVIFHSAHAERSHSVFPRDSTNIGPKSGLDFVRNDLAALLRGEDAVEQRRAISV